MSCHQFSQPPAGPQQLPVSSCAANVNAFVALSLSLVLLSLALLSLGGCSGVTQGIASQGTQPTRPSLPSLPSGPTSDIKIDVTPSGTIVTSGSRQQFAASVANTSNTAVVWSTTSGSISATGLFTAPSVKSSQTITVTARSAVNPAAQASATVMVEAAAGQAITISTSTLPAGTVGVSYSATFVGSGGTQPYRWGIVSGSLPAGLQLNGQSGAISGTSNVSGAFPLGIQITDATGNHASRSLQLTMAAQTASNCGPPAYPCSRSDMALIPANAPPQLGANPLYFGGHLGAGMVGVDPNYNNKILRVTDGNTDTVHLGRSYSMASSAERSVTSYDETLFMVHEENGALCLYAFDASQFSATFHGCFGNVGESFDFGYTAADVHAFYSWYLQKLYRYVIDTTNWTISPDPTFNNGVGFFDPDTPQCLNGQIAANHWATADSALSSDDQTAIVSVGPEQDKNPYYVVWNATQGCEWMNVQTWQVSRGWNTGLSNPNTIVWASGNPTPTPGGVHNAQIDRSGVFGVLTVNGSNFHHKLFWTIGTNDVDDTCLHCVSHWACDYGLCFWGMGQGTGYDLQQQTIGSLTPVQDMDVAAVMGQWGNDFHLSHANAVEGDKLIYLAAYQPGQGGSTVNQIWEDEILGVNWNGTLRTIRFNKNWDSGYGGFNGSARCSISRQGNYTLCNSDYQMNNLDMGFGNGLNQDTCDHTVSAGIQGTNGCRTDVLLFELR
jgi:hypothetical protein